MTRGPFRIVIAFVVFFSLGACIAFTAALAFLTPGGILEPLWRLNPRARSNLVLLGPWASVLMFCVATLCLSAAIGLRLRKRWGYFLAIAVLVINLIGDVTNVALGIEPRAAIGIPVVLVFLGLLTSRRMRAYFDNPSSFP
jgi:hypothetical protein